MKLTTIRKWTNDLITAQKDPLDLVKREAFAARILLEKEANTKRWYKHGGYWFIDWTKDHYKKWSGESLEWVEPYQFEFYLLMGTPHVERIVIEKAAQRGFTECLIALCAFALTACRLSAGMGFEAERKLRDLVPRIQAGFDYIKAIRESRAERIAATGRRDMDFRERQLSVAGIGVTFFYTSTSTKQKGTGERQASSAISSFTVEGPMLCDEIELWPAGTMDVAAERQSASKLPTKTFRAGSTPGHAGGIVDTEIRNSKHLFQWEVVCPSCGKDQPLDAFGNLLKEVETIALDGTKQRIYLDPTGRPLDWHCSDRSDRRTMMDSAYIGCQYCEEEIPYSAIEKGGFRCRNTRITIVELVDRLIQNSEYLHETVALRLPALASSLFNAKERIRRLCTTRNPADQIQQGLGRAVSIGTGKINLEVILKSVGRSRPDWCNDREPDLVVIGLDQGAAGNPSQVQHWWFPDNEKDRETLWREAYKEIVWHGEIMGFEGLTEKVKAYGVDIVGLDMEPEQQLAASHARHHPSVSLTLNTTLRPGDPGRVYLGEKARGAIKGALFLFDQVRLSGQEFKRSTRNIQDEDVPMFALHRTFGLDAVRDRFYKGAVRLPDGLTYDPGDADNLIAHYLASNRSTEGTWEQTPGMPDHFHHADNFAEMAVLAALYEPSKPRLAYGTLRKR